MGREERRMKPIKARQIKTESGEIILYLEIFGDIHTFQVDKEMTEEELNQFVEHLEERLRKRIEDGVLHGIN